jgi:hypothetical protein
VLAPISGPDRRRRAKEDGDRHDQADPEDKNARSIRTFVPGQMSLAPDGRRDELRPGPGPAGRVAGMCPAHVDQVAPDPEELRDLGLGQRLAAQ